MMRRIALLVDLVHFGRVSVPTSAAQHRCSERTILRDLQQFRGVLGEMGVTIGKRDASGIVKATFPQRPRAMVTGEQNYRALMAELLRTFGVVLDGYVPAEELAEERRFVRFAMPRLVSNSAAATLVDALRSAWENRARVRFRYHKAEREVEPYCVLVRSGRYYLIGRQVGSRSGWRVFSIDEIEGTLQRCGTYKSVEPPAEYRATDAVGWFKGGKRTVVEVGLSPAVARAAASRRWQEAQEIREHPDGSITLTLTVGDIDEVIRWALGFGADAWISSPPAAVDRAREVIAEIAARYQDSRAAKSGPKSSAAQ